MDFAPVFVYLHMGKLWGLNKLFRGDKTKKYFTFIPVKLYPMAFEHSGTVYQRECLQVFIKGAYYYSNSICAN